MSAGWAMLKRIVMAAEDRCFLVTVADVDIADDVGTCHGAETEAKALVQARERAFTHTRKHLAEIQKRSQLETDVRPERSEGHDTRARLEARCEHISVDEAIVTVAAQRLALGEHAAVAAEARQRPKWGIACRGHVTQLRDRKSTRLNSSH